ncbi:hypothetical protein I317_02258 [Kwoniella heveanensis CBS 569]|nr:hypothetical protein I317_02258 [Kwoniella heveanensis CBS 569]
MPRKGGPPRSLFHSLPFELKSTLRSQPRAQSQTQPTWYDPMQSGAEQLRIKAEAIEAASVNGMLGTQPQSEEEQDDEEKQELQDGDGATEFGARKRRKLPRSYNEGQGKTDDTAAIYSQAQRQRHISTGAEAGPSTSNASSSSQPYSRSTLKPTASVKSVRYEPAFSPPFLDPTQQGVNDAESSSRTTHSKRKKNKRPVVNPLNHYSGHPWDCTGLVERYTDYTDVPSDLVKYFAQRRLYFPEYDTLPLLLDRTGWFSVTPQPIAEHIAQRSACDVVLDAFCGVGGNIIEFAKTCERVIAIDNDLTRLKLARHNALHHGVADRIEFILGDYTEFARSCARATTTSTEEVAHGITEKSKGNGKSQRDIVDVVFLSPPWGGINYLEGAEQFPLSAILPIPGDELFDLTTQLTPNIAFYLPKNTDLRELSKLAKELGSNTSAASDGNPLTTEGRNREWVEVEEEWVGDKLKAITAYFGGLVADE